MRKRQGGFTLIEVVLVCVIIGVFAAVALPAYGKYVTKSRRNDAIASLLDFHNEQQQYHSRHNRYAADMTELGYADATMDSNERYYHISFDVDAASGRLTLLATPAPGGPQASDDECGVLSLRSDGIKSASGPLGAECW